ncbi:MAG: AGE family epimerase/isomerase [Cytophagales bacterium]|nr:AGE family epimerase/isomerase [Cytophagales bacterium]
MGSAFLLLSFLRLTLSTPAGAQPLDAARQQAYAQQVEGAFTQLLDACYPRTLDREQGGFYSTFSHDWKLTGSQDKMIVTQARHTWLPAKAAQTVPDKARLLEAARHGFHFLRDVLWDQQYGGFHTWTTRDGRPRNPAALKTAYGNAFGIFALAAYYETTGDTSALNLAKKAFLWLEKFSHDPKHKGYFQDLQRDGTPAYRAQPAGQGMLGPVHFKDQNSSIHLLEAFTELYGVWPDPLLRERTEEMLLLIRDRITTDKGYLTLFLTADWQPVSYRDSSEAVRKAHYALDHVSFGHDVETAYLMLEASHVLGREDDARTAQVAKKMVDHALRNGWDDQAGGFYERGYYLKNAKGITLLDDRKNWWAQAEGLNTLLLMALKYPQDPMRYGDKFARQWAYIGRYLIDAEHGGWYEWGLDKTPDAKTDHKTHAWKAAYHDGRSLMNCLRNLRPDPTPPPAPEGVTLTRNATGGATLQWRKSVDDRSLRGYDIYRGGKRIGFTPLTQFRVESPDGTAAPDFAVVARDGHGNASPAATTARK